MVAPGESLLGIAHRYGVPLTALARANNIQPYSKVNIGDRLTIPGGRKRRAARAGARWWRSRAPCRPSESPACRCRTRACAKTEVQETKSVTKQAEAAGGMPSFRWPVRGPRHRRLRAAAERRAE